MAGMRVGLVGYEIQIAEPRVMCCPCACLISPWG